MLQGTMNKPREAAPQGGGRRALIVAFATFATFAALPAAGAERALVISTDYSTGYYSRLELAPPYAHAGEVGWACADAAATGTASRGYIVGRWGCDHIQVVDAASFATLRQFSTGVGTNPQDIELVSPNKGYVSLYERDYLLIVDPESGATLGTVSLATFADADGFPEAAGMARAGNRLFVALQRLDRDAGFTAANPSLLAVVDCGTDQLVDADPQLPGVQAIPLSGRNPFGELQWDAVRQKIVVPQAGSFGVLDGGVEFVDPVTLQAEGFFATEAGLGGDLNAVRLWTDCTGWAIVNDASYRTRLVRFDRCSGQVLGTAWQSAGFDLSDVEIDFARGQVLVGDRDLLLPGVRFFAAGTGAQITAAPIDLGLPPGDIALLGESVLAGAPPVRSTFRLLPNWPDPFNPSTHIAVEGETAGPVRVAIFDAAGRLVRELWAGPLDGVNRRFLWNGCDERGAAAASGVYWVQVESNAGRLRERLTLVR